MILQGDNPVGDILASLVTAYGMTQQAKKQKADRERQAALDQQAATEAALHGQYEKSEIGRTTAELNQQGYGPNGEKLPPVPGAQPPPKYDPPPQNPKGDDLANWAANQYAKSLNGGTDADQKKYHDATVAYPRAYQEDTGGQKNVAQIPNIRGLFKHQDAELTQRLGAQRNIAIMRAQAIAAGVSRRVGVGKAFSSMGTDEKNNLYMLMALYHAKGQDDETSFRNALAQTQIGLQAWKDGAEAATSGLSGSARQQAEQQYNAQNPMPSVNLNVSGGGGMGIPPELLNALIQKVGGNLGVPPQKTKPNMPFIPPPLRKKSGPTDVGATSNYQGARPPGSQHGKNAQGVPGWLYPDGSFHPDN